jgi:O-methyltransferase
MALWLECIKTTSQVAGDIVEVGCYLGGTAVITSRMIERLGFRKQYFGIDTFSGFLEPDFEADIALGNIPDNKWVASDGCKSLAQWIARYHNAHNVQFIEGNIATLVLDDKIGMISCALVDCDLAAPTYSALIRLYPKLAAGGTLLVDDCSSRYKWQARRGVERFSKEMKIDFLLKDGMALLTKTL